MLHLLVNIKGYAIGMPLTPKNYIGAAIAAGASLLGGLLSSSSASNLNSRNRRFQAAENAKNRQHQIYMTEHYQTLQAQRQQALAAGLNPNLVLGNASGGSVAPPTSGNGSYDVMPENGFAEGVSNAVAQFANVQFSQSAANKNKAETNNLDLKTPHEVEKLQGESKITNEVAKLASENAKIDLQLKQSDLLLKGATTAAQNAMADNFMWQSKLAKYDLEELKPLEKQQIQTGISKDLAQIGLLAAQEQLTSEQAKLAIAQTYKAYMDAVSNRISANAQQTMGNAAMMNAETNRQLMPSQIEFNYASAGNQTSQSVESQSRTVGNRLSNETNQAVQRYVIKSMETSCEILGKQNSWFNANQFSGMVRDIGVGVGSAVGGISTGASKFVSGAIPIKGFK